MMVLWVALIVGGVWAALAFFRRDRPPEETPSAKEELDHRLAKGEITEEEYKHRRDLIGSAS
jgi:uncharacterized membrane protein